MRRQPGDRRQITLRAFTRQSLRGAQDLPARSIACLVIGLVAGASIATANRPNMVNALRSLEIARAELVEALPDKGGHRGRALSFSDDAIRKSREGIAYAGN